VARYLIDANLPRLIALWSVAGYEFVHDLGADWSDTRIWKHADANGLTIVSRDADFSDRVLVTEKGPSVIHIRLGNLKIVELYRCPAAVWPDVCRASEACRLVRVFSNRIESVQWSLARRPAIGGAWACSSRDGAAAGSAAPFARAAALPAPPTPPPPGSGAGRSPGPRLAERPQNSTWQRGASVRATLPRPPSRRRPPRAAAPFVSRLRSAQPRPGTRIRCASRLRSPFRDGIVPKSDLHCLICSCVVPSTMP
jgi:predicted nuclease of predicted toxin-antitoxin system